MQRTFGRIAKPDDRDQNYRLTAPRRKSKRISRYWSDHWFFGNQGQNPYCVGFAWVHWLSNHPVRQWVNPEGVYHVAQRFDEWPGEDYEGTSVRAGAKVLQSLGFISEYRWGFDLPSIVATVLEVGPVVFGTDWYEGMSEPDKYGYLNPTGQILGGHAYLVNGVDTRRQRFRIKNSWGQDWGIKGRAYLSFADAEKLITEGGEACLAIEIKPETLRESLQ